MRGRLVEVTACSVLCCRDWILQCSILGNCMLSGQPARMVPPTCHILEGGLRVEAARGGGL